MHFQDVCSCDSFYFVLLLCSVVLAGPEDFLRLHVLCDSPQKHKNDLFVTLKFILANCTHRAESGDGDGHRGAKRETHSSISFGGSG